jgi:predicted RNA binding protein YcfA (HicA-like mRNA interferase family)
MPDALRAVPGAKVVGALERAGFTVVSISGSRHVMRQPDGRAVVVPVHAGRDIAKGTLRTSWR